MGRKDVLVCISLVIMFKYPTKKNWFFLGDGASHLEDGTCINIILKPVQPVFKGKQWLSALKAKPYSFPK